MENLIRTNIAAGRLRFTTEIKVAAKFGEIQFIAVGTPPDEDGSTDLKYVLTAAQNIGKYIDKYTVIVHKSTEPVGTAAKVKIAVQEEINIRNTKVDFSVVSNPEFLKEGTAIDDFMRPDRIVLGVSDERSLDIMKSIYVPFNRNHNRLIVMDINSAELTKYAANAMLATRISFMNELALLAESVGADIENIRHGIGSDKRIGYDFLYPGCGYGGSCFPKDVQALRKVARQFGNDLAILKAVEEVNERQKKILLNRVVAKFGNDLLGKSFAIWGLSFKPNTDDMREAPSRVLIDGLCKLGAKINAYDPVAMQEARRIYSENLHNITFVNSPLDALIHADALLIVTEWKEFRAPNFPEIKVRMKNPIIFDGRNLYDPEEIRSHGIEYIAIGRSK